MSMTLSDFCAACDWLSGQGLEIEKAAYNGEAFGNWFVQLTKHGRTRRMVWDGRERWLILQTLGIDGEWTDEWVGQEPQDQTVEQVVKQLRD